MSRHAEVRLQLGSEERVFRLGIGQQRAIEERCDAGLAELASRLGPIIEVARVINESQLKPGDAMMLAITSGRLGTWRVDDYREVIYQGLVGGGEAPTIAGLIVKSVVDESPPLGMCVLAFDIILAALLGPEDEPLGEPKGAKTPPPKARSRGARRAGPKSTAPAR